MKGVLEKPAVTTAAVSAGAMTMVALCFANGLQGGMSTTWGQAADAIKHTFHVNDAALGVVPAGTALAGNFGAVPVAAFCARHSRTAVLSVMFLIWGALIALAAVTPSFGLFGFASAGFVGFAIFRTAAATLEATDPAAIPLIADWWPAEERAKRVSIFNTLAGVGGFFGLALSGVIVDTVGWRWAFLVWSPLAVVGSVLIRRQPEPVRGAQDLAYRRRLEEATEGAEHERVVELIEDVAPEGAVLGSSEVPAGWRETVSALSRLRSWRLAAIGVSISGLMGSGLMAWGIPYFKRTFHLSSSEATGLAPVLGAGAFFGVLAGGFLADRLLARGVLRARLWVTAGGIGGGSVFYVAAFSTTNLAIAAPLLAIGSTLSTLPMGPQFALMMDTTPPELRSQASAALNVLQASGALGSLAIGGLSTLFGENLRLALLVMSPLSLIGAVVVAAARTTYVEDVALVIADAAGHGRITLDEPPDRNGDDDDDGPGGGGGAPRPEPPPEPPAPAPVSSSAELWSRTKDVLIPLASIAGAGALLDAALVVFASKLVGALHTSVPGIVGLVIAATATRMAAGVVVAPLCRRFGRWRVVAAGGVLAGVLTPLLAVAGDGGTAALLAIAVGLAGAPIATAHLALLAEVAPPDGRARVFAIHAGGAVAARGVGAALLAALAAAVGWRWASLVCIVGVIPAIAVAGRPDPWRAVPRWSAVTARVSRLRSRSLLTATLGIAGFAAVGMPPIIRSRLQEHHLSTTAQGSLDVIALALALAGIPLAARLGDGPDRRAERLPVVIAGGLAAFGVGMALAAIARGWAPVGLALGAGLAGLAVAVITVGVVIVEVVPASARVPTLGLANGLAVFWGLTGAVVANAARSAWGPGAVLALLGAAAVAVAALVLSERGAVAEDIDGLASYRPPSGRSTGALEVSGVSFSYGTQQVLFDVDVQVDEGEVVALLGTNGAGKSTLLRLVAGLDHPGRGTIHLFGRESTYLEAEQILDLGVALLSGGRMTFPSLTVAENIRVGIQTRYRDARSMRQAEDEVYAAFPTLGERRGLRAGHLSGGQQQMLALGRVLLLRPRLLLLDELTLGLAPMVVEQLLAIVRRLNADGTSVLLVEQSANLALTLASHAVFLERGEVRFDGPTAELMTHDELLRPVFLT